MGNTFWNPYLAVLGDENEPSVIAFEVPTCDRNISAINPAPSCRSFHLSGQLVTTGWKLRTSLFAVIWPALGAMRLTLLVASSCSATPVRRPNVAVDDTTQDAIALPETRTGSRSPVRPDSAGQRR